MAEKQDSTKSSKKAAEKKASAKRQPKTGNIAAQKKPQRSSPRKKHQNRGLLTALILFCVLLAGFNLFLIAKLISAGEIQLFSGRSREAKPAATIPAAESSDKLQADTSITAPEHIQPNTLNQLHSAEAEKQTETTHQQEHTAAPSGSDPARSNPRGTKPGNQALQQHTPAAAPQANENPVLHPEKQAAAVAITTTRPEKTPTQNGTTAAPEQPQPVHHKTSTQKTSSQPLAKPEQPKKKAPYTGMLSFVFDDAGHNLTQLEHFLRLPFPCTIAVLPGLRYSSESARRIRQAGKQVILHQPMQSVDLHLDPGPGAIVPGLTAEQIKTIVRKNLAEIWPAAGMNNHEGSLITADEYAMKAVLEVAAEKHIFFLDSRTTAKSVAAKVAKEQNMTIWERAIFIDNDKSRIAMEAQIKKGLSIAKKTGSAIMIGHVFTVELAELLTEMYPLLVDEGFSLSAIAEVAQKGSIE